MTDNTIRVGIVGLGGIARGQHIPGYQLCENVEIAALCDVNPETLQAMGERLDVDRLTRDYDELVAYDDLDAVDICTWPDMHHPVAMAAMEQGKHVFCEKPLALNYALAREMVEAAQAVGLKTGVGFTHRLTPAAHLAHDLISSGALGDIYQVMAIYSMGAADFAHRPLTRRRTRAVTGGGPLFELGPHMVDMVRWWLSEELTAICSQTRTFVPQRRWADSGELADVDIEDAAAFMADLQNGGMALFINSSAITGRNFDQRVEVYGSKGALLYDQARPYELQACIGEEMARICAGYGLYDPRWGRYRQEEPYPTMPVPSKYLDAVPGERQGRPVRSLIPHFIASLRGAEPPILPSFYDGMKAQEALDAVLISSDERRWVDLPFDEG